ncbi:MAG: hypothetical protein H6757_01205 [Candidatus Omnitrophica bacterium]|nr:hypothetical protein [Candidatus Omnitrophota bacterium]
MDNLLKSIGFKTGPQDAKASEHRLIQYINLKLAALDQPIYGEQDEFIEIANPLLRNHQEKDRLLSDYLCPADYRIQSFLDAYLKDIPVQERIKLPAQTFILDCYGLARTISVPANKDSFVSDIVSSYRVRQGVLHNPKNDRRTTKGVFHIAEGGLPIPDDKKAVPKNVFANVLFHALRPPKEIMRLPFTSGQAEQAEVMVSLLLRPVVCPEVKGFTQQKTTEIRFFAPGSLVSNLDFVESIFGNAGDPFLPENDSALDVDHWTGHTGCVILAPHLITMTKKAMGLPKWSQATKRQKHDGMCWKDEEELYNDGNAFKLTCRDARGVMVTIIADNYFGYCKKEVKTQISFSANLFGLCEEEHSGGAIAFPSYDLGEGFQIEDHIPQNNMLFDELISMYGSMMDVRPEGYAVDKNYDNIIYLPENAKINLHEQKVSWTRHGKEQTIKLLPEYAYVYPSGYKVSMQRHQDSQHWHLIGTVAEGTLCHKPCTVSGGGKSEISKSIADAILHGPVFAADFPRDIEKVRAVIQRDFGDRFRKKFSEIRPSRPVLSTERSLGSVIKLLTPSSEYSDEYNAWLATVPHHIKELVFVLKRHYKPEWGDKWEEHFSVDMINGSLGYEVRYNNEKLIAHYLRVGKAKDGSWQTFKLRQDFNAAEKNQVEDDISASVVVPVKELSNLNPDYKNLCVKMVTNCEFRLFQRPDDAIYRGLDRQAEKDLSTDNVFLSNWEPLQLKDANDLIEDAIGFEEYSYFVKRFISGIVKENKEIYFVVSSIPRIINGKKCKNPRYLQDRPDLVDPRKGYLAQIGARFFRKIPIEKPVHFPVNAVLPGRRNNPPDAEAGIRPLAVYNPIHYQELPELFMDFITSVTGKSPSTTGAGSEGALTKGPFNALLQTADLNNALVSYILTGYQGFSSAAGYVGPNIRVDHDISLLIPELWCRMSVAERDPKFLIEHGYLEKIDNLEFQGKTVQAERLGYRITIRFVHAFFGRIFNNPNAVFSEEMLKPEKQSLEIYVDGIENIVGAQKRVAEAYLRDGSVNLLVPPLQALIYIMAEGQYQGKGLNDPEIRAMFTRQYLLDSDWYQERLKVKQQVDIELFEKHKKYLEEFLSKPSHANAAIRLGIRDRLLKVQEDLKKVKTSSYVEELAGTIGADPGIRLSVISHQHA